MVYCYKVNRKAITDPLNCYCPSFLFTVIENTDLLGAAQTSHRTVLIVTAQTSCHIAPDESNHFMLARFTTANQ